MAHDIFLGVLYSGVAFWIAAVLAAIVTKIQMGREPEKKKPLRGKKQHGFV
jgi:hypothetical protein